MWKKVALASLVLNLVLGGSLLWQRHHREREMKFLVDVAHRGDMGHIQLHEQALEALRSPESSAEREKAIEFLSAIVAAGKRNDAHYRRMKSEGN